MPYSVYNNCYYSQGAVIKSTVFNWFCDSNVCDSNAESNKHETAITRTDRTLPEI